MKLRSPWIAAALTTAALAAASLGGCGSTEGGPSPQGSGSPSGSAAAPPASASASASAASTVHAVVGVPIEPAEIGKVVNSKNQAPYAGPTGTLRGTIRVEGDPPPALSVKLPTGDCAGQAAATHGKLFRVGQGGALADALVAVTGYGAYVPPKGEAAKVTISRCSLSTRTVTATFGQRIEVANLDQIESYMPFLDGAPVKAVLVAIPRGDAVRLYPPQTGRFTLRDQLPNEQLLADVFVLAYATHAVTGLDGKYEISGIPVGAVDVNAMLPAINKASGQRIEIKEGDNTLDLTVTYDAKKDRPAGAVAAVAPAVSGAPAASGAPSAGPAASGSAKAGPKP